MNIKMLLHINNYKVLVARKICLVLCMILGLIAAMAMAFYHSTDILFQYNLGYTLLQITTIFSSAVVACASAFDKISEQLK